MNDNTTMSFIMKESYGKNTNDLRNMSPNNIFTKNNQFIDINKSNDACRINEMITDFEDFSKIPP